MDVYQAVMTRRRIRKFRPEKVSKELIREIMPIAAAKAVIVGLALGYPDGEAPINTFERERAAADELTIWIG
jgi:nitroreductase